MEIQQLRNKLERKKGEEAQLLKDYSNTENKLSQNKSQLRKHEKARELIKQIAIQVQSQLTYNINEITSTAMESILDDPYKVELEFVERRNKTECDIWFKRGENKINPYFGGGGAIDVAAFALRVAFWSMQNPRTNNVLILDEPFKHLKGEETNRKMLEMISQVSKKLGLQIIMVSDERVSREATIEATDKLFEVSMKNGVSQIEVIK